jgi:hypothetical protein
VQQTLLVGVVKRVRHRGDDLDYLLRRHARRVSICGRRLRSSQSTSSCAAVSHRPASARDGLLGGPVIITELRSRALDYGRSN